MIRDTIYNDLKEQGLILSDPAVLQLPPIRPPKAGLLKQVTGILAPEFSIGEGPFNVIILPVLNSAVLVARANTLICYKFELDKETATPSFVEPKIANLPQVIRALHICDSRFLNDRGEVPFLVEFATQLVLFYVDLKEFKLMQRNAIAESNLFSVRFLCEKEVLLLTRDLMIHHYTIQSGKIRQKNKKISAAFPEVPKDQYIHHCQIVGSIDEEQDSTVALFYLIKKKKKKDESHQRNFQVLKVKEYLRTFQGKIQALPEDYTVMMNLHSSVLPQNFEVWWLDGYYCIETKHQILILKKKFKKYLFIDNIMEKIHDHNLKFNQGAIVSSYGKNAMQLSVIQFGDPKCYSKILDTIQIDSEMLQGFRMLWPFKNEKETCLMFAFEREKKLIFNNVIKMEPMKKMMDEVKKCDKNKISVVQEIAVNLGINKKDFYLTLWQSSKREIPDIYQFLLPCGDVSSIKKEIRLTMRRKKIVVTDFLKILQKITLIIRHELKTNLSQQMLKEYIKNDFLLRKIKLKDKNKRLDHRDLDKVYNSSLIDMFVEIIKNDLYPQKKQVDPLHVMVDQPQKQVINLGHVFQEFRIVILQNYKKFLVDLLSNFTSQQIVNVIRSYYYLLPFYPFEINMFMHETEYKTEVQLNLEMARENNSGQKQNLWFTHMTSIEFNRQLSKERIQRELHEYYPTSKITDAINTLVNSSYGGSQKLRKHGLISGTIQEYTNKLKQLYNTKLFMKVCEYANETNPYSEEELSPQLVDIFSQQNKLTGQAEQTVRLYTTMHKFMLKNDFCEKKSNDRAGFTTEELTQFTSEDLVALFFLENRQRKEFIFNEFRDLYVKLDKDLKPDKFNRVIETFIKSENCSRIQLEIFIKQVQNKGIQFQKENQPLIELLIDGFCMKLQIREDTDTKHFIELMQEIELSIGLAMKVNKIMQVRRCLGILNVFHCEKFTYFDMLNYQKNNEIFKILLDRYFTQQIKRESVRIEDQEVSLDFCRNMLTVLLYILETIYYDVSEKQLLLTYGQILIEWKQFDVIKGILYDEDVLQKLNINKAEYVDELVRNSLNAIYTDQTIEFDEEVKRQIQDILDILQDNNSALRNQEYAKLKLVQIFEKWDATVHPFDIYSVCQEWNYTFIDNGQLKINRDGREEFINNLFGVYLEKLNLQTLQNIYTYLQLTGASDRPDEQINLNNTEYVKFILMFAQRLLQCQRYPQIIQIFAFVKQMNKTNIQYQLLTEAFLKQVCSMYPEPEQVDRGRELIEYLTQNYFDDQLLQQLFQSNFESGRFLHESDREETILVDKKNYSFHEHQVEIPLQILWKIAEDEVHEREAKQKPYRANNEELYYCYYFLLMVFRNPNNGLKKLDCISYNLQILTNLLFRLQAAIDNNNALWAINCYNIFKGFIKGLLLIGIARVREADENITSQKLKQQQENIEAIKNVLKTDKVRNKDLLDSIQRMETYTNSLKAVKKKEKELRYEKSKMMEMQSKPKVQEPVPQIEVHENNATMNLRTMRERKYEYTQMSNLTAEYISEKEALEAIYARLEENKHVQNAKKKRDAGLSNNLFLTGLGATHRGEAALKQTIEKILKEDLKDVANLSRDQVLTAIKTVYEDGRKDFHAVVNLLDTLGISDRRRIGIARLCKIYQGDIPTEDLRHIFPFEFFLEGEGYSNEEEEKGAVYSTISPKIQEILIGRDNEYLRSMAIFIGSILESNVFIDQTYLDTLIAVGQRYAFNQETIIRVRIIIEVLGQNSPHIVRENLEKVISSVKENTELKGIIKHELQTLVKQHFPKETDLLERIKQA